MDMVKLWEYKEKVLFKPEGRLVSVLPDSLLQRQSLSLHLLYFHDESSLPVGFSVRKALGSLKGHFAEKPVVNECLCDCCNLVYTLYCIFFKPMQYYPLNDIKKQFKTNFCAFVFHKFTRRHQCLVCKNLIIRCIYPNTSSCSGSTMLCFMLCFHP